MGNPLQLGLVNFNKGAYITIEGDHADHFFIVRSGKVRIERELQIYAEDGANTQLPGDFFGVVSTMSNHAHIENAVFIGRVYVNYGQAYSILNAY